MSLRKDNCRERRAEIWLRNKISLRNENLMPGCNCLHALTIARSSPIFLPEGKCHTGMTIAPSFVLPSGQCLRAQTLSRTHGHFLHVQKFPVVRKTSCCQENVKSI
jgi:hypothetical protein